MNPFRPTTNAKRDDDDYDHPDPVRVSTLATTAVPRSRCSIQDPTSRSDDDTDLPTFSVRHGVLS